MCGLAWDGARRCECCVRAMQYAKSGSKLRRAIFWGVFIIEILIRQNTRRDQGLSPAAKQQQPVVLTHREKCYNKASASATRRRVCL
eukprot:scaffold3136_cov123-Isochrysis_galbana.AAC.5